MNCQSFENVIDELAREQLIEARLRADALRHCEDCSTCAQRLAEERDLTLSLRALAVEMNSAAAPERVEHFLLAAFAERNFPQTARPHRWSYRSMAAAAVLLVALGIGAVAWKSMAPTKGPEVIALTTPKATIPLVNSGSALSPPILPIKNSPARPESSHRPTQRNKPARIVPTVAVAEIEVATDFMPIGYVSPTSLQDGGSVVRVELPRSTIISMGFAVNMDRYSERVKADVLMGADGLPRAIRFVQ